MTMEKLCKYCQLGERASDIPRDFDRQNIDPEGIIYPPIIIRNCLSPTEKAIAEFISFVEEGSELEVNSYDIKRKVETSAKCEKPKSFAPRK